MIRILAAGLTLMLSACGGAAVVQDRPITVNVPVAQPCVSGQRPPLVVPLKMALTDEEWAAMDVKQKSARVGTQMLDRMKYGEDLRAATGGCP